MNASAVAGAALLAACAAGAAIAASPVPTPSIPNCKSNVVAPKTLTLACADANYGLAGMSWRHWGAAATTGTGFARTNDCTPYCAAGHFHDYPVTATASRLRTCPRGGRRYTLLVLRYPGKRPAGVGRTDTWKFTCEAPTPA